MVHCIRYKRTYCQEPLIVLRSMIFFCIFRTPWCFTTNFSILHSFSLFLFCIPSVFLVLLPFLCVIPLNLLLSSSLPSLSRPPIFLPFNTLLPPSSAQHQESVPSPSTIRFDVRSFSVLSFSSLFPHKLCFPPLLAFLLFCFHKSFISLLLSFLSNYPPCPFLQLFFLFLSTHLLLYVCPLPFYFNLSLEDGDSSLERNQPE
jgi:hypothetical protein